MDVGRKSTGELIDALITTSHRCWDAQEKLQQTEIPEEIAKHAIAAQRNNAIRSALIREIDSRLDKASVSVSPKSYA